MEPAQPLLPNSPSFSDDDRSSTAIRRTGKDGLVSECHNTSGALVSGAISHYYGGNVTIDRQSTAHFGDVRIDRQTTFNVFMGQDSKHALAGIATAGSRSQALALNDFGQRLVDLSTPTGQHNLDTGRTNVQGSSDPIDRSEQNRKGGVAVAQSYGLVDSRSYEALQCRIVQLTETCQSGEKLYRNHACEDLEDLFGELRIGIKQFQRLLGVANKLANLDDEMLTDCSERLDKVMYQLQRVPVTDKSTVDQVSGDIDSLSDTATISRLVERLQRTMRMLNNLYATIETSLRVQELACSRRNGATIQQVYDVVRHSFQDNSKDMCDLPTTANAGKSHATPGRVLSKNKRHRASKSARSSMSMNLRWPSWLARRGFEFIYRWECGNRNIDIRLYNTFNRSTPIFEAMCKDDLQSFKSCLLEGNTMWDRDYQGRSLLTLSLEVESSKIVGFLLDHAPVDCLELSELPLFYGVTCTLTSYPTSAFPFDDLSGWESAVSRCKSWFSLMLRLVDVTSSELIELLVAEHQQFSHPERLTEMLRWLASTSESTILSDIPGLSLELRGLFACHMKEYAEFKTFLKGEESPSDLIPRFDGEYMGPLQNIALLSGPRDWRPWSTVILEIFRLDKEAPDDGKRHNYSGVLIWYGYRHRNPSAINDKYWQWLEFLCGIGVDLEHFGKLEVEALKACWNVLFVPGLHYRVVKLCYGPTLPDWKIYVAPDGWEYEMAGAFWNFVENPELFAIPGQFIGDDEEHGYVYWQLYRYYDRRDDAKSWGSRAYEASRLVEEHVDHTISQINEAVLAGSCFKEYDGFTASFLLETMF